MIHARIEEQTETPEERAARLAKIAAFMPDSLIVFKRTGEGYFTILDHDKHTSKTMELNFDFDENDDDLDRLHKVCRRILEEFFGHKFLTEEDYAKQLKAVQMNFGGKIGRGAEA